MLISAICTILFRALLTNKKGGAAAGVLLLSFLLYAILSNRLPYMIVLLFAAWDLYLSLFSRAGIQILKRSGWYFLSALIVSLVLGSYGLTYYMETIREDCAIVREKIVAEFDRKVYGESDLTEGDLTKEILLGEPESRLCVKTNREKEIYLKGFTGCSYTGTSWEELPDEACQEENRLFLQWLGETKQSPMTMLSMYLSLSESYDPDSYDVGHTSYQIENISARRKYLYHPYTPGNASLRYSESIYKDQGMQNGVLDQILAYDLQTMELSMEDYVSMQDHGELSDPEFRTEEIMEYFSTEQAYRDYVKQWYTMVPEETYEYLDAAIPEETKSLTGAKETTAFIRSFLKENVASKTMPAFTFDGTDDYLVHLLTKDKQGNSVAFATAATLMFRYFGYPARYVEGYARLSGSASSSVTIVELTNRDAHAWVEIYRYGMGWVPIEVTPEWYPEEEPISEVREVTSSMADSIDLGEMSSGEDENAPDFENDAGSHQEGRESWIMVVIVLLLALLIVVFFILRRKIYLHVQKKRMANSDVRKASLYVFYHIVRCLRKAGVQVDPAFIGKSVGNVDAWFEGMGKSFGEVLEIAKRLSFCMDEYGESDRQVMLAYLEDLRQEMKKTNPLHRLKRKYWDLVY